MYLDGCIRCNDVPGQVHQDSDVPDIYPAVYLCSYLMFIQELKLTLICLSYVNNSKDVYSLQIHH